MDSEKVLAVAASYYENRDKLIYSIHGNTFLGTGGELFDPSNNNKGRIDCSTFAHLLLQGISYEKSPYVNGSPEAFFHPVSPCPWANEEIRRLFLSGELIRPAFALAKFYDSKGQCRYLRDAESSNGRPNGIVPETPNDRPNGIVPETPNQRSNRIVPETPNQRSNRIVPKPENTRPAENLPEAVLHPGDLVFFQIKKSLREAYLGYGVFKSISHVGIVAEDPRYLYESSGNQTQNVEENRTRPGIMRTLFSEKDEPFCYVKCEDL